METPDINWDDDDHQEAYVNFTLREDMRELIEALTASCEITFPSAHTSEEVQQSLSFIGEIEKAREEEVRRLRKSLEKHMARSDRAESQLATIRTAADRLYEATLHTIHTTSDETARSNLLGEIAGYDYAVRDLASLFAEPVGEAVTS